MFHLICKTKIRARLASFFTVYIYEWWWMSYINSCAPIPPPLSFLHTKKPCISLPFELHGAPKMHVTFISFLLNTRTLILWCPLHAINTWRYQCWHKMYYQIWILKNILEFLYITSIKLLPASPTLVKGKTNAYTY